MLYALYQSAADMMLPMRTWATATGQTLAVNGRALTLFRRRAARDESLTFGSNTEGAPVAAHMYLVFVNPAP